MGYGPACIVHAGPSTAARRGSRGPRSPAWGLVSDEAVSVAGSLMSRAAVDRALVVAVPLRHRVIGLRVVPLSGKFQHPGRHCGQHHDAGSGRGQLTDERDAYSGRVAWHR